MNNSISWDEYFMGISVWSAKRSKDPHTKVGACIVNCNKKIIGVGYNGMPIGCDDHVMPWKDSEYILESKYTYVCHAEMNAIMNISNGCDDKECVMYTCLFPCNECVKIILQSRRVNKIVYLNDKYCLKWQWKAARKMLDMAGIECIKYNDIDEKMEILMKV